MLAVRPPPNSEGLQNTLKCPFSVSSTRSGQAGRQDSLLMKPAARLCPSSSSRSGQGTRRKPTDLPDLRRTPSADLLYLPPLLSSLPSHHDAAGVISSHEIKYTLSRLPDIDAASVALHKALHNFQPSTPNYAYEPYHESFNWTELSLPAELSREW